MSKWGPLEKKILTGEKLYSEGNYEDALTLFEEVIEEDPQNVAALNDAGVLHFEMENSEKSIKYLTDALKLSPGNLSSILTLIDNHLVDQNFETARDTFYSSVKFIEDPEVKQRYKSLLFSGNSIQSEIERGENLFVKGEFEKAENIFKGILSIDEKNADALNNLSVLYHHNEDIEKAKNYSEKALKLNPNDRNIRENYATLFGQEPEIDLELNVDTLRIAFVCGPGTTFIKEIEDSFRKSYDVKILHFTNNVDLPEVQSAMDWADITWFEWCDQILIGASNNLRKSSKVVCRLHGYEIFSGYPSQVEWNFVDKLIFVANHKKELFYEIFPKIDVDSVVIRNGVKIDNFSIASDKKNTKNLLLLGNLNYRKGLQLLIQYFRELLIQDPEYHLFIRGEWQDLRYKVYTANIIEELQLQNKITFVDEWVDDINEFMSDKSHILSFSIEESFHYSIGNGMAAGLKPVIHSWKESREIWPNEYIFNDLSSFLKIMLDSDYSPEKYRNLLVELNLVAESQYLALEREIQHFRTENSLKSSASIDTSEYQDNIKYWENRYEKVGGARTVGHINWDKETYDKETKKTKKILKPLIREISKSASIKNVLDFGCGIGRFAETLLEYSDNYFGIDPVKKVIDKNKSNFSASKQYHFGYIENGQIPFSNKKFDLIFSSFVFQHIIEDDSIKNYVTQFKKLLSKDGRLLFLEILNKEEGGGHMRYRSQQEFENLFDGFSFEKVGEYHYAGRIFTILSGMHKNSSSNNNKLVSENLRNDKYNALKRQKEWLYLSPYSLEDFSQLDDFITTGKIFSIKCEQLELQYDWEVEIGINNDKSGILAQFLYYNSLDDKLLAPVELGNKNTTKLVNIIKECINNPNISLNEQIRGNIYDLNLLNDIKSNLKEYVWERIFPCTVFSPLRPFMIHMDRYRFASENINSNQIVVDAACGMGYGTKFLSKFSQNAIGIDISEESIQMAQKYYQSDNIQWKVGDVLNLNIGDDSIDVFTSMETFEHITPPEQLLSEISRVLKKDGIAFISTPNGENHRRQQVNNPYHEHEYSYDELVSIYDKFFKEVELFGSKELGKFDLIDYVRRAEYENILIKASNPISS